MGETYNILVTGCGGDIGQSIGKILKSNPMFNAVIGCDMSGEHAGIFIFDRCLSIEGCRSESYLSSLQKVVDQYEIDIILPISEPELRFFAEQNISNELFGKSLITANLKAIEIGFDKYLTSKFLESSGLLFPETAIISESSPAKFPLIIKSRNGSGSKSIFTVNNIEEFNFYKNKYPDFIAQEYLGNADEEYTCGLFSDSQGEIRELTFKRKLAGGFSNYGIVTENLSIRKLLFEIAEKLMLRGSINIQLRLTSKGPYVFEINPRFSSTVLFRHMMGFQDVIWSIQDHLGLTVSPYSPPMNGTKFYKGFNEYVT